MVAAVSPVGTSTPTTTKKVIIPPATDAPVFDSTNMRIDRCTEEEGGAPLSDGVNFQELSADEVDHIFSEATAAETEKNTDSAGEKWKIKEIKEIIPLVTHFKYNRSAYEVATIDSFLKQLDYAKNEKLDGVVSFTTDAEGVLINELYDENEKQYLYSVVNMTEVRCEETKDTVQTTKIKFDGKYKKADVFKGGKWQTVDLDDGNLTVSLLAGDSVYVLPF